jgi:hypothetical protein
VTCTLHPAPCDLHPGGWVGGAVHLNAEVLMRRLLVICALILLTTAPAGAQFVAPGGTIPAVANTSGGSGSFWRSDVSILNLNSADTSVVLLLLPELKNSGPAFEPQTSDPLPIIGNGQLTLANVVTSVFGLRNVKGGLSIFSTDGAPLVIASRTYTNADQGGSYGLNVYGLLVADTAWIANVQHDAFYRTNIGIFMPVDPQEGESVAFYVTVYDGQGAEVASAALTFDQAGLWQKNLDYFGVTDPLLEGWVEIRCGDPITIWYGYSTVIDQVTNDSVYRPAVTRQSSIP